MDNTLPKLFTCKSTRCNLSFTNEDHLNIHEKKHEMMLTLENKGSNVFLVDQTPTPTKLIKNCEEVGLFDDLRHVNPFDETFRRAVETKSNLNNNNSNHDISAEHKILLLNEDTLHTPQVFPIETDEANNNCQNYRIVDEKIILSTNLEKNIKANVKQIDENFINKSIKRQKSLTEIVLKSNATKNIKITSSSSSPPTRPIPERILISASSRTSPILPNTINLIQPQNITWLPTTNKIILPKPTTVITSSNQKTKTDIKERLKKSITKKDNIANKNIIINEKELSYKNNIENTKLSKTKNQTSDSLERRRAAAVRYRKRKHIQQCDLQKRNAELLAENLELKSKLKQLQEILISHNNCDLTKTTIQNSPNGITSQLLRKSIPLIQIPASTIVMKIPKLLIRPGDFEI